MASVPRRKKETPPEHCGTDLVVSVNEYSTMASVPRRKKKMPPELLEYLKAIVEHADSFTNMFNQGKKRMKEIKREFRDIGAEVKDKLETADAVKKGGLIGGGIALGVAALGLAGALFTGGASLLATAAAVGGGGGAAVGSTIAVGALISEHIIESGGAEKLKERGNEFKDIIEPMAKKLAEICSVSVPEWEQNSADIETEVIMEYRDLIRRVKSSSIKCKDRARGMQDFLKELLDLISKVLEKSLNAEEDGNLSNSIIRSGSKCGKIISEFEDLKEELSDFKEKVQQLK